MDKLASLILRRYDGTYSQYELVSLFSSLIDRSEELTWELCAVLVLLVPRRSMMNG